LLATSTTEIHTLSLHDALPISEMDVPLAEPVVRAVTDALALGDTGYASGTRCAEALAAFAAKRWNWDGVAVERTAVVPDVMTGVDRKSTRLNSSHVKISYAVFC